MLVAQRLLANLQRTLQQRLGVREFVASQKNLGEQAQARSVVGVSFPNHFRLNADQLANFLLGLLKTPKAKKLPPFLAKPVGLLSINVTIITVDQATWRVE